MYRLRPDDSIKVNKIRVGRVPVLFLRPKRIASVPVAVLWLHGGGYMLGMKEMAYDSRAADMLRKYGVMVISPGYRLSWQKPYPAAIDDCYKVLEFIHNNKKKLGIKRIMIGGESAGGGLAAALCMMARDRGIHISFQMPLYPMISNIDTQSSRNNHGKIWNTARNHIGWSLYLRGDAKKKVSPYAAPSQQTDYRNLPPCYTFVGDGEPFYCETIEYVKNLKMAGVEADVDVYHTNVHAFDEFLYKEDIARTARDKLMEHFEYALRHYK